MDIQNDMGNKTEAADGAFRPLHSCSPKPLVPAFLPQYLDSGL